MHPLPTQPDGRLALVDLKGSIRNRADVHSALPGVICLENTHNRCGGKVLPLEYLTEVEEFARGENVPLHLDGARLANAAVALGRPMSDLAAPFDSVQLDLSKALAAPVGGLVAGSLTFIKQARRMRKLLGGGMRQAGIIAAAGIVALTEMVERLAEDHALAKKLAAGLAELPGIELDVANVHTNLVVFRLLKMRPPEFIAGMRERRVLMGEIGNGNVRMVTHYGVSASDAEATVEAARVVLG
jgi:threonine aldolase